MSNKIGIVYDLGFEKITPYKKPSNGITGCYLSAYNPSKSSIINRYNNIKLRYKLKKYVKDKCISYYGNYVHLQYGFWIYDIPKNECKTFMWKLGQYFTAYYENGEYDFIYLNDCK